MTSFPPMDKPITPRALKVWGAIVITIGSAIAVPAWSAAGAWSKVASKDDVAAAVAERLQHPKTQSELRELRRSTAALNRAVAVNMTRLERLPEVSEDIRQATAQIQILTAAALADDANPAKRRALRRAARQVRAEARENGDEDPLAGVEGL